MDGWSTPVLVQELLTLYAHKGDAAALPRVTPYRDYLRWLAAQDRAAARRGLAGGIGWAGRGHPSGAARSGAGADRARADHAGAERDVNRGADTAGAPAGSDAEHLHASSLGAFCSGRLTGRDDVVFGVTVAGRPPEIAGIETYGGAVHQYPAAADQAAAGKAAARAAQGGAGQPVATDDAPASRACGDPKRWPDWASCSTPWWCSRTIRSIAAALAADAAVCGSTGVERA